jgi:hypothetical protein
MSSADEDAAGISASLGDEGAALQRAQDKIATMHARAGALDELPRSGVLEDAGSNTGDLCPVATGPAADSPVGPALAPNPPIIRQHSWLGGARGQADGGGDQRSS